MRVELYVFKVSNVRYESRIIRFILVLKRIIDTFAIGNAVVRIVTEICSLRISKTKRQDRG